MSEYIDQIFDNTSEISDIGYTLKRFSGAFYLTGNTEMGEDLKVLSAQLEVAADCINKAVGHESSDRLKEAQAGVGSLLSTIINLDDMGEES